MIEMKVEIKTLDDSTAGDANLKRELLNCFESEFSNIGNVLNSLLLKGDNAGMAAELHKLKGAVGIFGFVNLANFIEDFEKKLLADENVNYSALLPELSRSIDEHVVELKRYIY